MSVKYPNQVRFFMTHGKVEGFVPTVEGEQRLKFFSKLVDSIVREFPVKKIGVGLYTNSESPEVTLIVLVDKGYIGKLDRDSDPELWENASKEVEMLYGNEVDAKNKEQIIKQRFAYAYCEKRAAEIIKSVAEEMKVPGDWVNIAIVFDEEKFEGVPYVEWVEIYDDNVGMLNGDGIPYEAFEVLMFEKKVVKKQRSNGILNLSLFKNLLKVFRGYNIEYGITVKQDEEKIIVKVLNDPNNRLEEAIKDVLVRNNLKEMPKYIEIVKE